jgi:hypothetical protein
MVPYLLNYPLLFVGWQGQALVSLHKLTKAEGLQIRGSVGLLETFYARGYLTDLSPPKMLSGANAFEISDFREDETETVLTKR